MKCDNRDRRVPVLEASKQLGIKNPQHLRLGLQQGKYPFGTAVLMPSGRWSYYINSKRLEVYRSGEDMVMALSGGDADATAREDKPVRSRGGDDSRRADGGQSAGARRAAG